MESARHVTTTDFYSHILADADRTACDALDKVIFIPSSEESEQKKWQVCPQSVLTSPFRKSSSDFWKGKTLENVVFSRVFGWLREKDYLYRGGEAALPLGNIVALLAWGAAHCSLFPHSLAFASSATGNARPSRRLKPPCPSQTSSPRSLGARRGARVCSLTRLRFICRRQRSARSPRVIRPPHPLVGLITGTSMQALRLHR